MAKRNLQRSQRDKGWEGEIMPIDYLLFKGKIICARLH